MPIVPSEIIRQTLHTRFSLISKVFTATKTFSQAEAHFKSRSPLYICQQKRTMKAYLQVIGGVSKERAPTVILHYDSQRYLFNCGEGTQRLCVENKLKLAKMKNIFLSRINWDCVGGLPGMLLTMADGGIRNISIHGPKNLTHFMVSTRHFVYRTSTTVETHEFQQNSDLFQDENLKVIPVIAYPDSYLRDSLDEEMENEESVVSGRKRSLSTSSSSDENMDVDTRNMSPQAKHRYRKKLLTKMFVPPSANDNNQPKKKGIGHYIKCQEEQHVELANAANTKIVQAIADDSDAIVQEIGEDVKPPRKKPASNKKAGDRTRYMRRRLPATSPIPAAISYICRGPEIKGKFNKSAAVALGIKPGPLYGKLHRGESVKLENGKVIDPSEVCDPPIPGHVFIIVDCPSPEYIPSLTNSDMFNEYQGNSGDDRLSVIIHMLGRNVLENKGYQAWMNKFPSRVEHIVGDEEYNSQPVLFNSHALSQLKLSKLNDGMFPIPQYSNVPEKTLDTLTSLNVRSSPMENMLHFDLEPKPVLRKLDQLPFDHSHPNSPACKEVETLTEYIADAAEAKQAIAEMPKAEEILGGEVEITTLGTGSSLPSKYRNVSATLVDIPNIGSVLLDAGESTYGQMLRMSGSAGIDDSINNLKAIFISHLHADHHLGVVQVLSKWFELNKNTNKKMFVISPWAFKLWLEEYADVQDFGLDKLVFINNEDILYNKYKEASSMQSVLDLQHELGLNSMQTVDVIHCRWAYGVSLDHSSGWKLVYSGDTRPCQKLVDVGKDATVLLHEATLEDDMMEEALAKRHSTTAEAVEIGKKMNAKHTLLTHFSQRYPKIPVFTDAHTQVGISFDMMRVKIKDLPTLPKYVKALQTLYKDSDEADDNQIT